MDSFTLASLLPPLDFLSFFVVKSKFSFSTSRFSGCLHSLRYRGFQRLELRSCPSLSDIIGEFKRQSESRRTQQSGSIQVERRDSFDLCALTYFSTLLRRVNDGMLCLNRIASSRGLKSESDSKVSISGQADFRQLFGSAARVDIDLPLWPLFHRQDTYRTLGAIAFDKVSEVSAAFRK